MNRAKKISMVGTARCAVLLLLLFSCLLAPFYCYPAHVEFHFADFTQATPMLTNRVLQIIPTNSTPAANGNNIITSDRISYTNDYLATVTVSNMVTASYHCVMKGPFKDTAFQITVPDTNAVLNAKDLLTVNTNAAPNLVAYSMTSADALFVKKSNSWSIAQSLTNAIINGQTNFGALLSTNPFFIFGNIGFARVFASNVSDGLVFFADDPAGISLKLSGSGGVRFPLQTANTLARFDSGPDLISVPNAAGALTNNGSGTLGWSSLAGKIDVQSGTGNNNILTNLTATSNLTAQANAIYGLPDMALGPTNATGGARWLSFMPDFTRRRWSMFLTYGSGSIFFLEAGGANTGTLSYEAPTTNSWWSTTFTTPATINNDAGANTTAQTWFPGKNVDWNFIGRLPLLGTNQVRHWIGLTSTTLANMGGTDSPTTRHVAAVRASPTSASDVNWTFVTCDGTSCTATPSTVALSTNITHIRIVEDFLNSRWLLFINGSIAATNSANRPAAAMGSIASIRTLQNVAQGISASAFWGSDADKSAIKEFP